MQRICIHAITLIALVLSASSCIFGGGDKDSKKAESFVINLGDTPGWTTRGQTFSLGDPAAPAIQTLGKPAHGQTVRTRTVLPFHARGVELGVDKADDRIGAFTVYFADELWFKAIPEARTREGIHKGSSLKQIKKAYGDPDKLQELKDKTIVTFKRPDGVVLEFELIKSGVRSLHVYKPLPPRPTTLPTRVGADSDKLILFTATDPPGLALGDKELAISVPGSEVEQRWGKPDQIKTEGPADKPILRRLQYNNQGVLVIESGSLGIVHISVFLVKTTQYGESYAPSGAVTDKGIGRGSTRADVLKAYGKPRQQSPAEIQYETSKGGLTRFKFNNDVLYEISIQ